MYLLVKSKTYFPNKQLLTEDGKKIIKDLKVNIFMNCFNNIFTLSFNKKSYLATLIILGELGTFLEIGIGILIPSIYDL